MFDANPKCFPDIRLLSDIWLVSVESRSCDMYLLHFQLSKSFQVSLIPFSDGFLSKMRKKTWDEEPYI